MPSKVYGSCFAFVSIVLRLKYCKEVKVNDGAGCNLTIQPPVGHVGRGRPMCFVLLHSGPSLIIALYNMLMVSNPHGPCHQICCSSQPGEPAKQNVMREIWASTLKADQGHSSPPAWI